jgi:hypothetical protein
MEKYCVRLYIYLKVWNQWLSLQLECDNPSINFIMTRFGIFTDIFIATVNAIPITGVYVILHEAVHNSFYGFGK